jgi:hypothetical protein
VGGGVGLPALACVAVPKTSSIKKMKMKPILKSFFDISLSSQQLTLHFEKTTVEIAISFHFPQRSPPCILLNANRQR